MIYTPVTVKWSHFVCALSCKMADLYYAELKTFQKQKLVSKLNRTRVGKQVPIVPAQEKVEENPMRFIRKGSQFVFGYLQMSSIHGLGHMTARKRHYSEYTLWAIVLILALSGTIYVSSVAWRRYLHDATVISIEKDYKEWTTPFPTANLCLDNKVDPDKLKNLTTKYGAKNEADFMNFFTKLSTADYDDFNSLPEYNEVSPDNFMKILLEAQFKIAYGISNSYDDGAPNMTSVVTELGLCHAYNSDVANFFTPKNFMQSGWPKHLTKTNLVYGSPLDGELFTQIMGLNSGYNIYITGPYDLPDVGTARSRTPQGSYKTLEVSGLSIISADSVRDLSVSQRKCRYYEESDLDISDRYTYLLCRMQCRLDQAYRLCNCVPHFYKKTGKPYCDVKGLKCLGRHADLLINLRDPDTRSKIPCGCNPLCNDVHFVVEVDTFMLWRATNLKWSMSSYPRVRLVRETIFGFSELLVSVGGTAGLFLGCSVLSFIEIIYFFTLRLVVRIFCLTRK